tara:strand:+ start:166 stop:339 length:174 start_codon:yes stop_codon:yes gene_type:complete
MNIFVKDLKKNKEIAITVEPEDNIRSIKLFLKTEIKVSAKKIKILYDQKLREDNVML